MGKSGNRGKSGSRPRLKNGKAGTNRRPKLILTADDVLRLLRTDVKKVGSQKK
jgi:hypothetical protein